MFFTLVRLYLQHVDLRDRAVKLHMAVAQEVAKLKLNLAVAQEAKLELSISEWYM